MILSGECILLGSVSSQQNLMWWTLEPSACHSCQTDCVIDLGSWTGRVIALRQISVTAPCYSSILVRKYLENTSLRREDMPTQRCEDKRAPGPLTPLFICIPPPPPVGLRYVNWTHQECLFYLGSSLWSSDLPLFYFLRLFPSLSFSHCHSGLLFPSLPT